MPHTHHSHSGQFCNHAVDPLREIVTHAFEAKKMSLVALTEHVPRPAEHLYPDEATTGWTPADQERIFESYVALATTLRSEVSAAASAPDASALQKSRSLLVGFEAEWIDADAGVAAARIKHVLDTHASANFDFWIGSVHHVAGHAIDFDGPAYEAASIACGGEAGLWCAYFDAQHALLTSMHPPVVGHFDLIRLKSSAPDASLPSVADGAVWARCMRNLAAVKAYGGLLEVNSAGLRKGLRDVYPGRDVLRAWRNMDGDVVLSDDSHGVAQVGACYEGAVAACERAGFRQVCFLEGGSGDANRPIVRRVEVKELRKHPFFEAEREGS